VTGYLARRLLLAVLLAFGSASVVFLVMHLAPGDAVLAALGEGAGLTPSQVLIKRHQLGLDASLPAQYAAWLWLLLHGDLGRSFIDNRVLAPDIVSYFGRTLELMAGAVAIALVLGIPAGLYSAARQDSRADVCLTGVTLLSISVPNFVLGTLLLLLVGLRLRWVPVGAFAAFSEDPWLHLRLLALPAFTLGVIQAAGIARMMRASTIEIKRSDYVRTAESKGLSEHAVLFRHMLRNALIPVVTLLGADIGRLMGGAVIVEFIFTWPGVSTLLLTATQQRDYPMVQGIVLIVACGFVLINLVVDVMNAYLDPRLRYG
jgi:peptide/nickel transport system permease protein